MLSLDLWKDYLQSLISPYYFKYSNTQTSYRWSHYRTLVDRSSGPFRYDRSWCFRRPTPHRPPPHSPVHPPPSLGAPLHHRCPPGSSLGLGPRAVPPPSDGIEAEKFLLCVLLRLQVVKGWCKASLVDIICYFVLCIYLSKGKLSAHIPSYRNAIKGLEIMYCPIHPIVIQINNKHVIQRSVCSLSFNWKFTNSFLYIVIYFIFKK